jgi:hypothetical protein
MSSPIPIPNPAASSTANPRRFRRPISALCLSLAALTLGHATTAPAQAPQQPPPGVMARISSAHKIFLSNAGSDDPFLHDIPNGATIGYNQLYASLQQWGYFQLVDNPAQADLIFQLRGTETAPELESTFSGSIVPHQHAPMLVLTILAQNPEPHPDPQALTLLDTITIPAGRAESIPKGNIAFAQSIEGLTYKIGLLMPTHPRTSHTLLAASTARPSFETLAQAIGPIPPQVLNAKSVYLDTDTSANNPYLKHLTASLTTWGYYRLVDSPGQADAVFTLRDAPDGVSITIHPPNSKAILWTICDPHYGFYRQGGEKRAAALTENLISTLKQLNHIPLTPVELSALR